MFKRHKLLKIVIGLAVMLQVCGLQAGSGYLSQGLKLSEQPIQLADADSASDSDSMTDANSGSGSNSGAAAKSGADTDTSAVTDAGTKADSSVSDGGSTPVKKARKKHKASEDSDAQADTAGPAAAVGDEGLSIQESNMGASVGSRAAESEGEETGAAEEGQSTLKGRANSHEKRTHTVSKPNNMKLVLGGLLAVAGVIMMIAGFEDNPQPNGKGKGSIGTSYGVGGNNYSFYPSGTYTNTGNCGELAEIYVNFSSSGHPGWGETYFAASTAVANNGSSPWSGYFEAYLPYSSNTCSFSSTQTSDGTYAANSLPMGIVGICATVLGLGTMISGLTATQEVMADNGVDVHLAQSDNSQLLVACSKSF